MVQARGTSENKGSLLERGLKWDEHFNRRLGVVAVAVAGVAAVAGAPVIATGAALFAGGGFAAAEIERRVGSSLEKRRLGKQALAAA